MLELITNDLPPEEMLFFQQLHAGLKKSARKENLQLTNLVAVAFGKILLSDEVRDIISETDFAKGHGLDKALSYFRFRLHKHYEQAQKVTQLSEPAVMLACLSSVIITKEGPAEKIPGQTYHQDGRGNPLTTKITLVSPERNWEGGKLNLIKSEKSWGPHTEFNASTKPGGESKLLNPAEAILFNNKELHHCVNGDLTVTEGKTERIIFQERLNPLNGFNWELLKGFGLSNITQLLSPLPIPIRIKSPDKLTVEEKTFIAAHETPNRCYQEKLGQQFPATIELSKQLDRDGVLIFPNYYESERLRGLQGFFNAEILKKQWDPLLGQASFNGAVDATAALPKSKAMSAAIADPAIITLLRHYFGKENIRFANWRGYALKPHEPVDNRAWGSYHNDQKHREIKVMILLSDVAPDGQAMRLAKGSHKNWWNIRTQRDTKYTPTEALIFTEGKGISKCYGPAGTIIIFDTNAAHAGVRNLSKRRDVITFNFVPGGKNSALFPVSSLHPDIAANLESTGCQSVFTGVQHGTPNTEATANINAALEKLKSAQQDMGDEEIEKMVADYPMMPRFSDLKPRHDDDFADTETEKLKEFLKQHAEKDLQADLDLKIRFGDGDVMRDIQLVKYRDGGDVEGLRVGLKAALNNVDLAQSPKVTSLDPIIKIAEDVFNKFKGSSDENLQRCAALATDLADALKRCDTIQRLRSNLMYLYFVVADIKNHDKESSYEGEISEVLTAYAFIVKKDDAAYAFLHDKESFGKFFAEKSPDIGSPSKGAKPILKPATKIYL